MSKELIKDIILGEDVETQRLLFSFDSQTSNEKILKKFELFTHSQYPRYFKVKSAVM